MTRLIVLAVGMSMTITVPLSGGTYDWQDRTLFWDLSQSIAVFRGVVRSVGTCPDVSSGLAGPAYQHVEFRVDIEYVGDMATNWIRVGVVAGRCLDLDYYAPGRTFIVFLGKRQVGGPQSVPEAVALREFSASLEELILRLAGTCSVRNPATCSPPHEVELAPAEPPRKAPLVSFRRSGGAATEYSRHHLGAFFLGNAWIRTTALNPSGTLAAMDARLLCDLPLRDAPDLCREDSRSMVLVVSTCHTCPPLVADPREAQPRGGPGTAYMYNSKYPLWLGDDRVAFLAGRPGEVDPVLYVLEVRTGSVVAQTLVRPPTRLFCADGRLHYVTTDGRSHALVARVCRAASWLWRRLACFHTKASRKPRDCVSLPNPA